MGDRPSPLSAAAPPAPDAGEHVRLWLLRSALALAEHATLVTATLDDLLQRHPALRGYVDEAARSGLEGLTLADALARLDDRLGRAATASHDSALPLDRLRHALDLDANGLTAFLLCGLCDEDPNLAPLIDELIGHDGRPIRPMLARCFPGARIEAALAALLDAGFLGEEQLGRWRLLSVPPAIWSVLRGLAPPAGVWRFTSRIDSGGNTR